MKLAAAIALATAVTISAPAIAQSGRAEITIPAQINLVKPQLINEMLNRGYYIQADTPYLITFDKVSDNFGANLLFGTRGGGVPHARVTYSMAEINGQTRIMADAALIGNPGTGFERRNDMNGGDVRDAVQQILNTVAAKTIGPIPPPPPPIPATAPASPAQ